MTKLTLVLAAALSAATAFGQEAVGPGDAPIQVVNHPSGPATQFLQNNASWQALTPQQGILPFTDTKTKRSAIFGNVTHQDYQSGAWVQNEPSLSSTSNGWRIDGTANQVLIQKSGASQHVVTQTYTDYTTKHNSVLAVTVPTLTYSTGFTFNFTQDGLNWDLRFLQSGFFEFGTTVTKKLGAATHRFTVSSSETLSVNSAGQLVGNANVGLNQAVMLPRFGKAVPCSAWSYSSKTGLASFTCDDSAFKANQLPYRIDPQSYTLTDTNDTFYIDAYDDGQGDSGNDDASAFFNSNPYPPQGASNVSVSCSFTTDWSSLASGDTIGCWLSYQYFDYGYVNVGITANGSAPYSDSAMVSDLQYIVTWGTPPPPAITVSPTGGSVVYGTSQTFTVTATPTGSNIYTSTLNFGGTGTVGTCSMYVYPTWTSPFYSVMYFNSNSGTYQTGSYQNNQCSITGGSATPGSGGSLSFTVNVTFTLAFVGSRGVWVTATDYEDNTTPWTQVGTLNVEYPTIAAPSMSPAGGTYSSGQSVTLSDSVSGATIVYTKDGSTPTQTHGTVYNGTPVSVPTSGTINALAYATDYLNNSSSATYTIVYPGAPITGSNNGPGSGTPGADSGNGLDPRRAGVRALGAYWGASGESIDTTSANLNFASPLIKPFSRGSWNLPFVLSYNSQMWRNDSGGTWLLGQDTGYGIGWKLQAGSITPIWAGPTQFDHYLYTDATGAEYSLSVNNNNVWTSLEGVYVSYDATANRLYSTDGSFWYMGCQSSSGERDAGTLYPTTIEDTNGNQIVIAYEAGVGSGTTNSSARIAAISDPRSSNAATYLFTYNTDAIPHLTKITTGVYLPGETWQFTYTTATLTDPFAGASYGSTALLASAQQTPISSVLQSPPASSFFYNASAELVQYTTPMGGSLSWTYEPFTYNGGIKIREVTARSMNDAAASLTNSWTLSHPSSDSSLTYHSLTYLLDNGAASQKVYGSGIPISGTNLVVPVSYAEENSSGSTILLQKSFTWTHDTVGNAYVGTVTSTLNPGTGSAATSSTVQTLDIYGNLTQQIVYDYSSATTPYRTYNFTYLGGAYATLYIRNRLTLATATGDGGTVALAGNAYDATSLGALLDPSQNNGPNLPSDQSLFLHDSNYGTSFTYRGNPTSTYQYGMGASYAYLTSGVPYLTQDGAGMTMSVVTSGSTAYSLPSTLTPNSNGNLASTMAYTSSFALTSVTGPNGVTQSVVYDSYNRPNAVISADGAQTGYSYTYAPNTQTAYISTTTNGTTTTQWKQTTYDGFGRTTRVQTGHDAVTPSNAVTNVDTQYGACGCSPLGKATATSMPYAPGSTVYWNTNTYDTSGRTLTQTKPDGSVTTTSYTGNSTIVTDPAGKWKKYTNDATGGLVTVYEPDPNNGSSNPVTYYTLNGAGQIVGVSVQRNGVAQNRSFTWSGTDLIGSTDPETGTTTYQYDGNHHVLLRTDAKGQQTRYTYDSYERLIETQYYTPTGYNGSPAEVTANRVAYGYDTNPNNPYDPYTWGRLTQVSFSGGNFSYYYDYNQAGRVTGNQFTANNGSGVNLQATYAWDTQGRMTNMTYPSGAALNYAYDSMGRLSQIASPNYPNYYGASATATYTSASQLSTLTYGAATGQIFTETRTYNTLMQLTQLTNTGVNMQYNYTVAHNNGRVAQTVDGVLGETVNYTYDMWNRLTAATATNGNWGEQYTFDNFGNLTGKTPTAGSAPALNWPGATNQTSGAGDYDGNGNPVGYSNGGGPGYLWDVENHLATDQTAAYTPIVYTYDPWGRRVWKQIGSGRDNYGNPQPYTGEVYFYGATGQKMETYSFTWESSFGGSLEGINIYFGGKLLQSKGVWVATDKLGSVRANSNGESMSYWPYGEERDSTANGREKFATYTRDGVGQDYAEQRYYNSSTGAFWTPDPGGIKTADPNNPSSWNRYPYVTGDPANHSDSSGMEVDSQCGPGWQTDASLEGPCCDPSGNGFFDAAPDPACYAGVGGGDVSAPPAQQPDQCSVSLWERPTPTASSFGWHTYVSTTVYDPNTGTTTTEDIEGGPKPGWAFIGGKLTGTIAAPGQGLNQGTNDATNPQLPTNKEVGTAYSGPNACSDIAALMSSVNSYNSGSKVTYNFLGKGGYNSNSFTFTLDSQLGLISFFGQPAGWVPGWGKLVPGL